MWHASISIQNRFGPVNADTTVERIAVAALRGVGGNREWWQFSDTMIGHLRVPVTDEEYAQLPEGVAEADAGPTGEERERSP